MSAVCQLSENCLFLGWKAGYSLTGPHAAVRIPADVVVGIEFEDARQDAVKKVLDGQLLSFFCLSFCSLGHLPGKGRDNQHPAVPSPIVTSGEGQVARGLVDNLQLCLLQQRRSEVRFLGRVA